MGKYCMKCMNPLDSNGMCANCGNWVELERQPHQLASGTVLNGRYLIGEILGQGGFGITYMGRDLLLDLRIALKEYYPTGYANRNTGASDKVSVTGRKSEDVFDRGKERFLDEARTLAKYQGDPGIVSVLNFFEANDTAYIVMEYLDGTDLQQVLQTEKSLPMEWVFTNFEPIMASLERMHRDHVVHRDVSPDNIMLLKDGSMRLMDLGAARTVLPDESLTMSVMLKSGYAPEEQYRANGKQGPWTDIYALCATMYKCITGITPVDALQRLSGEAVLWPSNLGIAIPEEYEGILKKGMAIEAKDRFQSITEMRKAIGLAKFANEEPPTPISGGGKTRIVHGSDAFAGPEKTADRFAHEDEQHDEAREQAGYCVHCGKPLMTDYLFCTHCGHRVTVMPPSVVAAPPKQEPVQAETPAHKPDQTKAMWSETDQVEDVPTTRSPEFPNEKAAPQAEPPVTPPQRNQDVPSYTPPQKSIDPQTPPLRDKTGTGKKGFAIAIAIVVAIAAIAFAAISFLGGESGNDIEAKAALKEYSWSELSAISAKISEAESPEDAIEIAKAYNLVDENGKLDATQTKMVEVEGANRPVRIIGIAHDEKTDGGVAGITFQFVDCLGAHAMNSSLTQDSDFEQYAVERGVSVEEIRSEHPESVPTNAGGWEGSGMRTWLKQDVLLRLPDELQNAIVAVDKRSNNTGNSTDAGSVTVTSDLLWLPSRAELCGPDECETPASKQEGQQYQLYKEQGVSTSNDRNPVVQKLLESDSPTRWWLRSPSGQTKIYFGSVKESGELGNNYADNKIGVAPCFCI